MKKPLPGISVDIRNLDRIEETLGLSLISGYDYTVDITVRGTRSELNRLNVDDISAYIDAKDISAAGEYTLPIRTSLPNGVTTGNLSVNYITIYVDKRTTISVPIEVLTSQTIESDYTLGTPELNIETVNVTGPEEELAKIDHAVAYFDLGRVSKTLISTGKLVLVDQNNVEITNPYVKLQTTEVTVKFPVYTFKDVPLTVEYKYGYYNDSNVTVTIEPSAIRIKGDPDVLADIDSIVITSLDEKKITDDLTQDVTIMLPDDIENVSGHFKRDGHCDAQEYRDAQYRNHEHIGAEPEQSRLYARIRFNHRLLQGHSDIAVFPQLEHCHGDNRPRVSE